MSLKLQQDGAPSDESLQLDAIVIIVLGSVATIGGAGVPRSLFVEQNTPEDIRLADSRVSRLSMESHIVVPSIPMSDWLTGV